MRIVQQNRQMLSPALCHSLKILELSHLDLADQIREDIEKNPLLEHVRDVRDTGWDCIQEQIASRRSLREHLLCQVREEFDGEEERAVARALIDQLDERGFFIGDLKEDKEKQILVRMQRFSPRGIFSRSMQECFLNQLEKGSLAERVVREQFQDFLLGRFCRIQRKQRISPDQMREVIRVLARLSARPAAVFEESEAPFRVADLSIMERDQEWIVEVKDEELPALLMRKEVSTWMSGASREERKTLYGWLRSARFLKRALMRRVVLLQKIGSVLMNTQASFFVNEGVMTPIPIQDLARALHVHPTTAWRAVTNKVLACPRGMVPLKLFFSSSETRTPVLRILKKLILCEDRAQPLTDLELVQKLQEEGFRCTRRTVAHYRAGLKLAPATKRKLVI